MFLLRNMGKNFRSPSQATTSSVTSYSHLSRGEKIRQKTKKDFRSFGKFLYDKEKNTFCKKTCKHWGLLTIFYLMFLVVLLGAFFGLVILIMYYVKSRSEPYCDKTNLVPGSSPAIGISPRLPDRVTAVIWYSRKETTNKNRDGPQKYITAIDNLLKPYDDLSSSQYVNCDIVPREEGKYCSFTRDKLGPCGKQGYGYNEDKPCIYLKLNKMKGWTPEREEPETEKRTVRSQNEIQLDCNGITSFDRDHVGKFAYYPSSSFKDYYFPYDGSSYYRSPLVSIQFENLDRGFVIGVKCSIKESTPNMQDETLHTATVFLYVDNK